MTKNYQRNKDRERRYGIDAKSVKQLLVLQNYRCMICTDYVDESSPVDHCHETGKVRGILCPLCNSGLGFFRDSELFLENAIVYLRNARRGWR
jgi:hypothetical protein